MYDWREVWTESQQRLESIRCLCENEQANMSEATHQEYLRQLERIQGQLDAQRVLSERDEAHQQELLARLNAIRHRNRP